MPGQVAAEVWVYPTSLLPRRWADLNQVGALFHKKAVTLGTDGGTAGYSVTHGNRAAGEPLYSRLTTGAVITDNAWSTGYHDIARVSRLPEAGQATTQVFAALARLEAVASVRFQIGLTYNSAAPLADDSASIYFDSGVSANFRAYSYATAAQVTDTGVAADTNYHIIHIEVESAAVRFYIDGSLKATHTTQVPDGGLPTDINMVSAAISTLEAVAKSARYCYVAVWLE